MNFTLQKSFRRKVNMVFPNNLQTFYEKVEAFCRNRNIIAGKSERRMKFPYTLTAKIVQFPYFYYMKNNNIWMYYPLGCFLSFFIFVKIHRMSNSEENIRSWAEIQRKIAEKEHKNKTKEQ